MKKIAVLFALILCFLFQNSAMAAGTTTKIGVVDMDRCMKESNEGKRVTESLKKEFDAMQQKYVNAQKELSDLQKDLEKQSLMLSSDARESKQSEYDRKNRELNYLSQDLSEDAQTAQQNANQKMLKQLNSVIQNLGKQQAFDLVLEKSNTIILYASSAIDITDLVIKELNKVNP
jgi:outer membrane protein